jgi:hypothetical protein
MKLDMEKNDLMRIVGLGVKKRTADDLKYGRFNRRMIAATIDSIALIALSPFLEMMFSQFYGPMPVDFMALQEQVNMQTTKEAAAKLYLTTLHESGFFRRWAANVMFQFGVLAVLTALCWWKWSSSPGKMIMRLKIVDAKTEQPIKGWQIVMRVFGYFISGLPFGLGFIWISFNKRRQGWHDMLANTVVVTVPWGVFNPGGKKQDAKPTSPTADP